MGARAGTGRLFVAAIAALAIVPACAQAAPSTVTVGFYTNTTDRLSVSALGDSVTHEIAMVPNVTPTTARLLITDSAGIAGPSQCVQVSPTAIDCDLIRPNTVPGRPERGVAFIEVTGGDAADRIDFGLIGDVQGVTITAGGNGGDDLLVGSAGFERLFGGSGRDLIDGGAGDDKLSGQAGNDRLTGAAGRDRIRGGGGIDKLFARDGERDDEVNCEGGSNKKERAFADRQDPDPESC